MKASQWTVGDFTVTSGPVLLLREAEDAARDAVGIFEM